jgi:hypothetical protein
MHEIISCRCALQLFVHANVMQLRNAKFATRRGFLDMWNIQQTKTIDAIRELTLDEVQAVSGGGDGDNLGGDFDGGEPVPTCIPGTSC